MRRALRTTRGFRDIYEIGRINRPESYNLFCKKHRPLIPRALRFEINERVDWQGKLLIPLDDAEVLARAADAVRQAAESAGADPGPVCYGRGGAHPTVTDANLVLGRIHGERFLGGDMRLDADETKRAMAAKIASPLGLDETAAADGILRIATITMFHVVRGVTTERGLDAADFALIAYSGAGPLHARMVARELRVATVIIPSAPGHFSVCGMLGADLRRDFVVTWF